VRRCRRALRARSTGYVVRVMRALQYAHGEMATLLMPHAPRCRLFRCRHAAIIAARAIDIILI